MLLKIWKYFIVEYVSGCNRCFRVVELSKGDLTVGVYKRLLVDPDTLTGYCENGHLRIRNDDIYVTAKVLH